MGELPANSLACRFEVVDAKEGKVALHHRHEKRFLRMSREDVDAAGETRAASEDVDADQSFTLVDAGDGKVALHNELRNRFLRMMPDGTVDARGGEVGATHMPSVWTMERLTVVLYEEEPSEFGC